MRRANLYTFLALGYTLCLPVHRYTVFSRGILFKIQGYANVDDEFQKCR